VLHRQCSQFREAQRFVECFLAGKVGATDVERCDQDLFVHVTAVFKRIVSFMRQVVAADAA